MEVTVKFAMKIPMILEVSKVNYKIKVDLIMKYYKCPIMLVKYLIMKSLIFQIIKKEISR